MEGNTPDALVVRIAYLEKSLGRFWWVLGAFGLLTAALTGFTAVQLAERGPLLHRAPVVQGRVSAKEFVVADDTGKTIAWFGSLANGATTGLILSPNGSTPRDYQPP